MRACVRGGMVKANRGRLEVHVSCNMENTDGNGLGLESEAWWDEALRAVLL